MDKELEWKSKEGLRARMDIVILRMDIIILRMDIIILRMDIIIIKMDIIRRMDIILI